VEGVPQPPESDIQCPERGKMDKMTAKLLVPQAMRRRVREMLVSISATHLHGHRRVDLSKNEAVVTCVVKNGEFYIDGFIKHYTELGFRHIFFLDNGSSDQTVAIAKEHDNVTIYQSTLPVAKYQGLLKRYLAQKFVRGGWCLDADIDEFFDYPCSDVAVLGDFLDYLNKKKYTAVITQLLDMFSDGGILVDTDQRNFDLKSAYPFYDISAVTKVAYHDSPIARGYGSANEIPQESVSLCFGGIRKTLYGNDCLLTKHSLFFPEKKLDLFPHVHFVNSAKLADVSCLMRHYKLTSNALEIAMQNKEMFLANSDGYGDFIEFLRKNPNYAIRQATAKRFENAKDLVEDGFLFMSREYADYADSLSDSAVLND
jgi:hypothetical protein